MSILSDEKQYHLQVSKEDVGKYVLLPGDPGRVEIIASYLEHAQKVAQNREYTTFTGYLEGERVSVVSTGIGGPSAAIAVEELVKCGCHTFIRIGSSGGIREDVKGGDLVIASAAVRAEGTSKEYLPAGYPAAADFYVTTALAESAQAVLQGKAYQYHVGVVQSKDSFYGETNPETMPVAQMLERQWEAYVRCGCLTSEMECAAVFSVAIARGVRAGAVLSALWNAQRERKGMDNPSNFDMTNVIQCAVGALRRLIAQNQ